MEKKNTRTGFEIAVIGMSARFPGARNIHEFWENLKNGVESLSFFTGEELREAGVASQLIQNPDYVKTRGGVLGDIEYFDAPFFDYTPREVEVMDPQMRLFHECCWEALEDSGCDPDTYTGLIGLYAGSTSNFDWEALVTLSGKQNELGGFAASQLINKDYLCVRVSYKLNLKGPSVVVQSACSTSLVAIHLACRALLSGECDMALAGGVSIETQSNTGYLYQEGMILSPDGHCRAFDAKARGIAIGNGAGVVVLKPLENAIDDGDHIYAMIKWSAINNDGRRKVGFSAPSIEGQAEVIRAVLEMADVQPESITYVETHGTGTPLGDPVEIEALKLAFNTEKQQFCRIGSVKTNFGHLDVAAGAAGFIKTVLALKYRLTPPSLNFETPTPKIDLENSPFYVNTELSEWNHDEYPLRAGVSSFGIGGTNAHLILEEAPEKEESLAAREWQIILLSAKTETALEQVTQNLSNHLQANPGINLADVAYTLQVGRKHLPYRRKLVSSTIQEVVGAFSPSKDTTSPAARRVQTYCLKEERTTVIFMFSGLGSQYVNMGRELYQKEPIFRKEMDVCFKYVSTLADDNIKDILYPSDGIDNGGIKINTIEISQIVIFIFEYSLAHLLVKWGIKPDALIGYSFGEYVAACLAGVISLEDALRLIVFRGKLIRKVPPGAMLSVPLSLKELEPLLNKELSIAIDNGPSCIVSGSVEAIEEFEGQMREKRFMCMRLQTIHAIHAKMMEPILKEYQEKIKEIKLNKPQIPYISNVTGDWLTGEETTDPGYWARHLRNTVRFGDGISQLTKSGNAVFIEIGPGRDLNALVSRLINNNPGIQVLNLVRHPEMKVSDVYYLLNKIGQLWLYGAKINWDDFYVNVKRHRVPLPTYPFEGQRYWIEGNPFEMGAQMLRENSQLNTNTDITDWFYLPSWKHSYLDLRKGQGFSAKHRWLIFLNQLTLGKRLVKELKNRDQDVIVVTIGDAFAQTGEEGVYTINPKESSHYAALFGELQARDQRLDKIVHLWNVTGKTDSPMSVESFDETQFPGFYSLLYMVKALGKQDFSRDIRITILTDNLQKVVGGEYLNPEKATILGLAKVIPQEYPNIRCRSIDLHLTAPGSLEEAELIDDLLEEFTVDTVESLIAYRNNQRWVQIFEPFHLENPPEKQPGLKEQGVYLITGGLGGIGLIFSELLIKRVGARLILTGRSALPPRDGWDQWLENHDTSDPVALKIKKLQELEAMGGKILYIQADVAHLEQMQKAVIQTEKTLGKINGVIHAAGIVEGQSMRPIQELSHENCQLQFQAKVYGTIVLDKLFKDKELDFFLMLSSVSCVLGGLGFGAYASANLFMDVVVKKHNQLKPGRSRWFSLNWDGMNEEHSRTAFEQMLALKRIDQLVASNGGNLQARIDQWVKLESLKKSSDPGVKTKSQHPRPPLLSDYVAPTNATEKTIASIWQDIFGFDDIGIQDDFLELGGDSLRAITVISRIHQELSATIPLLEFFSRLTIKKLAKYINEAEKSAYSSILPTEKKEYYTLSSPQRRLYILQQMEKDSTGYNQSQVVLLEGTINRAKLQETFNRLLERHETLRTSIEMVGGEPVQRIHKKIRFEIDYEKIRQDNVDQWIRNFIRPFDMSAAPFLRVGLVKIEEFKYLLIIDMHHIVTDGISHQLFIKETMTLYGGQDLPGLKLQYKDYTEWQNSEKQKESIKRQKTYWLNAFKGEIPILNLPADYKRPPIQRFEGNIIDFSIGSRQTRTLKELGRKEDATLYMILLAIYNVFLWKLSGQGDVVVGTPVAGRENVELQSIMGIFINTLAMRNYPSGEKTFKEFLKEVREHTLGAFENRENQFEDLIEQLAIKRDLSRNPLFDAFFVLQNMKLVSKKIPEAKLSDFKLMPYRHKNMTSKFDLTLDALEADNQLDCSFEYSSNLFKVKTLQRFISYFNKLVESVIADIDIRLSEIELLNNQEKQQLLYEFNDTQVDYPKEKTLHELFQLEVGKAPHHTALVYRHEHLTFNELNKKSNQLARALKQQGVKTNTIAVIMVERSLEMIIGLLATMKAGGAYLPIDPDYPEERVKYMLKDSAAQLLLSEIQFGERFGEILDFIDIKDPNHWRGEDGNPNEFNESGSPVYVIYTSGSTGKPKGVVIEHRPVVNYIKGISDLIQLEDDDCILSLTTISFDIFGTETFFPLLNQLKVVLGSKEEQLNTGAAASALIKEKVTIFQVTPSRLQLFLSDSNFMQHLISLRYLLVGGEVFPVSLLETVKQLTHGRIINLYGPTETTIWSTAKDVTGDKSLTIGKPICNTGIYIMNTRGLIQPLGSLGEICIGGDGLARGYLNRVELTADKFVVNPYVPSDRIYHTGDLGKWLPDGNLDISGRMDNQVKVRGFRVEPEEIEARLMKYNEIKEAVVIARQDGDGDAHLVAYVVSDSKPAVSELRGYLSKKLPHYMIPSYFMQLDKIPLTPNGKVNRKALPKLEGKVDTGVEYVAPQTHMETIIESAWKEVLRLDRIGIYDNFFDLGGTSIKIIQVNNQLKELLGKEIPIVKMFQYPTIHSFYKYLTQVEKLEDTSPEENELIIQLEDTLQESINIFER